MADVIAIDMAVASPAKVIGVHLMRGKDANGIRSNEKSIVIKLGASFVTVVVETEFCVVAWKNKILTIVVGDERILMAIIEGVEQAICVFFGLVEPNDVVLILVAQSISKDTHASIGIGKNEATEVAGEGLGTSSDGEEVVVRAHVGDFGFVKPFLERPVGPVAVLSIPNIGRDDGEFLHMDVVLIEDRIHSQSPIRGLKGSIALKEIEAYGVVLGEQELIWISEELVLERILCRFEWRGGYRRLPIFK